MDPRTPKRIPAIAALLLACTLLSALNGCRREDASFRSYYYGQQFKFDIPSDWQELGSQSRGSPLHIISPDDVNELSASMAMYSWDRRETSESLEKWMDRLRRHWKDDPNFAMEPLTTVRVGKFTGLTYSYTTTQHNARSHRDTPAPPPVPYKETWVHFETPGGSYNIKYGAPTAIYEKHRPAFERLLKSFRWTMPAEKGK